MPTALVTSLIAILCRSLTLQNKNTVLGECSRVLLDGNVEGNILSVHDIVCVSKVMDITRLIDLYLLTVL